MLEVITSINQRKKRGGGRPTTPHLGQACESGILLGFAQEAPLETSSLKAETTSRAGRERAEKRRCTEHSTGMDVRTSANASLLTILSYLWVGVSLLPRSRTQYER